MKQALAIETQIKQYRLPLYQLADALRDADIELCVGYLIRLRRARLDAAGSQNGSTYDYKREN